jgi:hypothetical protein
VDLLASRKRRRLSCGIFVEVLLQACQTPGTCGHQVAIMHYIMILQT